MIYTTSEIWKKAVKFSQMQNVDLEYDDAISLINAQYRILYEQIHKAGENWIVKEKVYSECLGEIKLPEDHLHTLYVGLYRPNNSTELEEVPINTQLKAMSYYESNRTLHFNPNFAGPVLLKYIPRPVNITFPRSSINIPSGPNYLYCFDDEHSTVYYVDTTIDLFNPRIIYSLNLLTGDTSVVGSVNQGGDSTTITALYYYADQVMWLRVVNNRKCVCYFVNNVETVYYQSCNYAYKDRILNTLIVQPAGIATLNRIDTNQVIARFPSMPLKYYQYEWTNGNLIWDQQNGQLGVQYDGDNTITDLSDYWNEDESIQSVVVSFPYCYVNLYSAVTNRKRCLVIAADGTSWTQEYGLTWGTTEEVTVVSASTSDITGYGIIYLTGGKAFIGGWVPDTVLEYSNEILFDVLISRIGLSILSFLNQSPGNGQLLLAGQYEKAFFTTIKSNWTSSPRIKNIRNRRSF